MPKNTPSTSLQTAPLVTVTVSSVKGRQTVETLVVPVYKGRKLAVRLPADASRSLSAAARKVDFSGEWGVAEFIAMPNSKIASFVALIGLGEQDSPAHRQAEGLRRGLGKVVQDARRHLLRQFVLLLPNDHVFELAAAAVEAAELATYRFSEHRKKLQEEQEKRSLRKLMIQVEKENISAARQAVAATQSTLSGITLARKLVDQPASHASPASLVETARKITQGNSRISLVTYDRKEAEKRKFNAFLAVARGSSQEPYVIHLTYKGSNAKKKVALVGKGITFDSGGLSLKPAQGMADMKIDMAGAATVLGVFETLSQIDIPVEVHGIIAACENMPSGNAYRPGDVVEAMNGKTIEISNTDAEGRVTLADALTYASQQNVDATVDIATLTGASMVALGETHAGLWSNNKELSKSLLKAAKHSGEGLVAMPLPEEYRAVIQSPVADVINAAKNYPFGGAITAALFLQEFVNGMSWAHMDVAGPAYISKPFLPYYSPGATGYGVRTLIEFLRKYDSEERVTSNA